MPSFIQSTAHACHLRPQVVTDVIFVHVFGHTFTVSVGWGGSAGSQGVAVFSFSRYHCNTILQSAFVKWYSHRRCVSSGLLLSLPTLVFLILAFLVSVSWYLSHYSFNLHFPGEYLSWVPFCGLLVTWAASFMKSLFRSFAYFSIGLSVFLLYLVGILCVICQFIHIHAHAHLQIFSPLGIIF